MTGYHHYKVCIESLVNCAALCQHCASSCLKEEHVHMMANCIQLTMECAAICNTTAQLMSLGSDKVKDVARLCALMCDACAEECNKHANQHCMECAEACSVAADQCETVLV